MRIRLAWASSHGSLMPLKVLGLPPDQNVRLLFGACNLRDQIGKVVLALRVPVRQAVQAVAKKNRLKNVNRDGHLSDLLLREIRVFFLDDPENRARACRVSRLGHIQSDQSARSLGVS